MHFVNFLTHCEQICEGTCVRHLEYGPKQGRLMHKKIQLSGFACIACALSFAMLILFGIPTAQAKQCSAALPSNPHGHWSYRLIDGRKCWYEGENNFSKSLLQWPEQTSALSPADIESVNVSEKPDDPPDPELCCGPVLKEPDSFENRWRGIRRW